MNARKSLRWAIPVVLVVVLAATASALLAEAPADDVPPGVQNASCDLVTLEPGASKWYPIANHPGQILEVTLRANSIGGITFDVYTQEQYNALGGGDVDPIGVGTPNKNEPGHDLTWEGRYPLGGTYYVLVTNANPFPVTYRLCSYEREWAHPEAPAPNCGVVCAGVGAGWSECPLVPDGIDGTGLSQADSGKVINSANNGIGLEVNGCLCCPLRVILK